MAEYTIGIDPGQAIDPTAFAAVQRIQNEGDSKPLFRCGYLERLPLNTPYPGVIRHARRLISGEPFLGRSELVLDLTGVGRAVGDLFRQEGLTVTRVTITAGQEETITDRGIHHVAKLALISVVQTLLHDGRLHIQKDLPDAPVLRTELEDFRASITDSGRWTFGARSGAHDDLVLALALAVWRAAKKQPMRIAPEVLAKSAAIITRPQLGLTTLSPSRGHNDWSRDSSHELRALQMRALHGGGAHDR
jgi:hypothetical protein